LVPGACILMIIREFRGGDYLKVIAIKLTVLAIALATVIPASVFVSNKIEATYNESIVETINNATNATETIEEEEDNGKTGLSGVIDSITNAADNEVKKFEGILNNFIEAIAVLLVTSCVIPVIVLLFFVYLTKTFLGQDIDLRPHKKE
ncbi:MAG: beta-carotene 15,15'-monooxygenase, partial [Erysipelotrichaceae bacterium]|nr:beta-carotene 15,15'-monooxygenase [Erysipelotrichaceae bacterium]